MSEAATTGPAWLLPQPRLLPQREDSRSHWLDQIETVVTGVPAVMMPRLLRRRLGQIIPETARFSAYFAAAGDHALREEANELRRVLRIDGLRADHIARSFALIRELSARTVGLRHFDVQLLGGYAMLKGMLAEMATGEGKTL